jgi:hypothetical protein
MLRKITGWVSAILLVVTALVYNNLFLETLPLTLNPATYVVFVVLFLAWYFCSVFNKFAMAHSKNDNWMAIGSITLGVVATAFYLIAINVTGLSMITGVIIPAALFIFWLIDIIDLAIQKTCKA